MSIKRWVIIVCVFLSAVFGQTTAAQEKNSLPSSSKAGERPFVLLVQPTDSMSYSLWFEGIDRHAKLSAKALNMDFEHFFTGDDRNQIPIIVKDYIQNVRKPDYLLFSNQIGIGVDLLELSEEMGVKAFIYGSPLEKADLNRIGGPRKLHSNWIGQIIPDDEMAGFDLANVLIEEVRKSKQQKNDTTPIRLIGITGSASTPASALRTKGLKRAASTHKDVNLLQVVSARWATHIASEKYELLNQRYDDIDAVWAANDDMALAVLRKAKELGKDPKVGGFDWTAPAIEAVKNGELTASMGGHDMEVAFAMMILRADFDGKDLLKQKEAASLFSNLIKLTPKNVDAYTQFFEKLYAGDIDYSPALLALSKDTEKLSNLSFDSFRMHTGETPTE